MSTPIRRKPRGECLLKSLAPARQQALYEYMEGDQNEKGHSYKECIAWLAQDGMSTDKARLSLWRDWYLSGLQLRRNEQTANQVVADMKAAGLARTVEEELEAGQIFFSRLAMNQQDNLAFVRILRERTRKEIAKTDREKFEFDAAKAALKVLPQLKAIAADSSLDENAKINRIRERLFGELPPA